MPRHAGEFCWINVVTPAPDIDKDFFGAVLGWTFAEIPGMGWAILVDGKRAGGVFPSTTPDGRAFPPGIGVMVQVADAAASAAHMRALGGRASEPIPVGPRGLMVDAADPEGAGIDLWQSLGEGGAEHDLEAPGAPFWYELISRDVPRAVAFYHALFGWTAAPQPLPDFTYTVLQRDGVGIAGIMPHQPGMGDIPAFWAVYLRVRDVDATVAEAQRLGGHCFMVPHDPGGVGRLAGLTSPQGVMFYVMAPVPPGSAAGHSESGDPAAAGRGSGGA